METTTAQTAAHVSAQYPDSWPDQWAYQWWNWMEYRIPSMQDRWVCLTMGNFDSEQDAIEAATRHAQKRGGPVRIVRIPGSEAKGATEAARTAREGKQ